jgi:hypothetical protein
MYKQFQKEVPEFAQFQPNRRIKMTNWFDIDCQGWKRMNAGRPAGHLIREAISNSFDEDSVTLINLDLKPGYIKIEDDGQRNQDIQMLFTIFMTDKKDSHLKRGRKGRGLKELLSVANQATIQTIGNTITFNEQGRTTTNNDKTQGTIIEIHNNWTTKQIKEAIQYLNQIIAPVGKTIHINTPQENWTLYHPHAHKVVEARLPTTIIENDIEKTLTEKTTICTYHLKDGEKTGWIYEMGIPIEKIPTDFHIDIQQRIPMNDNRDTIADEYKNTVYAAIINNTRITEDLIREKWFLQGISECQYQTIRDIAVLMSDNGKKVFKTNKKADDIAKQNGYEILDPCIMPKVLRDRLLGYIDNSDTVCDEIEKNKSTPVTPDDNHGKFGMVMSWLAERVLGEKVDIQFYNKPTNHRGKVEKANYTYLSNPTISYNCHPDAMNDFIRPLSAENMSILAHEMAHRKTEYHDDTFVKALETISGKLVYTVLHKRDELERRFGHVSFLPGKTCKINCIDCGEEREIKVQDKHQVTRCVKCQGVARKQRAKMRRSNEKQN